MSEQGQKAISAQEWWGRRRRQYNIGLMGAGALAFVCYVTVVFWGSSNGTIQDADITLFTTLFQGAGYLVMMLLANILYYLGPLSERLVQPSDPEKYRRIMFGLGFWFSVLLPFSIPATLLTLCLIAAA